MNRLIYLKEAHKDEIEAMIIYHKRMGRDALWDILEVLNDAEGFMTKEEISQKINRKNIGTDLKFLTFINVIDWLYKNEISDHAYCYAINYDYAQLDRKEGISANFNVLRCDLSDYEKRLQFIKMFKPRKRIAKKVKKD